MKSKLILLLMIIAAGIFAQDSLLVDTMAMTDTLIGNPVTPEVGTPSWVQQWFEVTLTWISENVLETVLIIMGALELIVRLTPTKRDNNLLRIIQSWLDFVLPNYRKGGGRFAAFTDEKDAPPIAVVHEKPNQNDKPQPATEE